MNDLFANRAFQATFLCWAAAQVLKFMIELLWRRTINFRMLTTAGGMPSSHSALVSALATSVGLREGLGSSLFLVTVALAMITMYDAAGIRRAASIQARILNQIIAELFEGHPISETKLRELLGHTPIQVVAGALLGIFGSWWWMTR